MSASSMGRGSSTSELMGDCGGVTNSPSLSPSLWSVHSSLNRKLAVFAVSAGERPLLGVSPLGVRFGDLLLVLVLAQAASFGAVGSGAVLPDFSAFFLDRQAAVVCDPSFLQKSHFNFSFGVLH